MAKIDKDELKALKNEILMAEAWNKEELLPVIEEALSRYVGEYFPGIGASWDLCLNEVYPIIQNLLPSIFFRNPRAFLKARNKTFIVKVRDILSGKMKEEQRDASKSAKTQEALLNYSLSEIKYKQEVRKVLLDALLAPHGVLWHGYKGDFGMTEEMSLNIKSKKVFIKRVSPLRFLHDPAVNMSNLDEGKWVGRIVDVPYRDFIEDDLLDIDKDIKKLGFKGYGTTVGAYSELRARSLGQTSVGGLDYVVPRRSLLDYADKSFQNSPDAMFVRCYEIFKRPSKKEFREGEKGKILLLNMEQEKALRVNEWVIKAEGWPSKILQFNELNDSPCGISDVDTYKQVADQKNAIVNLQLRNAQENGKNWIAIAGEGINGEEDIEKIKRGENTIIIFPTDNINGKMAVASGGGQASSELYQIDQRIQRNLEDKSGVTDLKRGFLQSGEESATSVKIRNAGGAARPAYRQDLMKDFLTESCHYLIQMIKQFVPYEDAVRIIGSLDIEWSEDFTKEDIQADVDVELDVVSMLPENPEKELETLNQTLMLLIQGITIPEVKLKLEQEGKTVNLSPIIEQILVRQRITNPEVFRNIKPEESEGFSSNQQLREAQENANAALAGQPIPHPPLPTDDHNVKLAIYTNIQELAKASGHMSDMLEQLIQIHTALLQEIQEKQDTPGQRIDLKKPSFAAVGA